MGDSFIGWRDRRESTIKKFKKFLKTAKHGDIITWQEIEENTGIPMRDLGNRSAFRYAMRTSGVEWRSHRSVGLELDAPVNVVNIIDDRANRLRGTVHRTNECSITLSKHLDKMTLADRHFFRIKEAQIYYMRKVVNEWTA